MTGGADCQRLKEAVAEGGEGEADQGAGLRFWPFLLIMISLKSASQVKQRGRKMNIVNDVSHSNNPYNNFKSEP
jgi:hypothetical protein